MAQRANNLFSTKAADLFSFVYGRAPSASAGRGQLGDDDDDNDGRGERAAGGGDDDDDDFFQPAKKKSEAEAVHDLEAVDGEGLGANLFACCSAVVMVSLWCMRPLDEWRVILSETPFSPLSIGLCPYCHQRRPAGRLGRGGCCRGAPEPICHW